MGYWHIIRLRRGKPYSSTVPSPCVKTCRLEEEVCVGCGRTKAEISQWLRMTDEEKNRILKRLKQENESRPPRLL